MTQYNVTLLDLDITGSNPANLIQDEPHTLSNAPTRSIAPSMGAFFAESVIVRDGAELLIRNIDYQIVELHQEATLRLGREISTVILILNSQVSPQVSVTYQALGGHYAHSDETIANIYQSVIQDNRPVNWTNVFNKPTEYNPTIHRHLLDDVYGFEPVVDYLERIKRAITLGQTTVLVEAFNAILSKFKCGEIPQVLPSSRIMQYDAFLYFLSKKKIISPVTIDTTTCSWSKGNMGYFEIDTRDYPINRTLYWEFYKQGSPVSLLTVKSGSIITDGTIQKVWVYIPADPTVVEYPMYLGVKENLSDTEFIAVSYIIDIQEYTPTNGLYAISIFNVQEDSDYDYYQIDYGYNDELRLFSMLTRY